MERNEFKKALTNVLKAHGFKYNKKVWYYDLDSFYIIINLQKSNFGDYYYINYEILIKEINPDINTLSAHIGDIVGRFSSPNDGDEYDYKKISLDSFENNIKWNIENNLKYLIETKSLRKYLELNPDMLYKTTLKAKEYLGIKDI